MSSGSGSSVCLTDTSVQIWTEARLPAAVSIEIVL